MVASMIKISIPLSRSK